MFPSKMIDITMQQVLVFLKAAEYENFSKVASELHMTQPTVSRNINAIETTLGLILFIRAKQRVRLTPAGAILYENWAKSMERMEDAYNKAFIVQGGQLNQLSIVDNNSSYASSYLLPVISIFESRHPNVHLNIERTNLLEGIDGMLAGKYDVGFFVNVDRELFENAKMTCIDLFSSNPVIIIPEKHPLYKKKKITVEDLKDQSFIIPKSIDNNYLNKTLSICREYGFQPHNRIEVPNPQTANLELAKGKGLTIMDDVFKTDEEFRYRDIELANCTEKYGFILVYPNNTDNKNVEKFKEAALSFSKEKQYHLTARKKKRPGDKLIRP